jgi:endoglucanase
MNARHRKLLTDLLALPTSPLNEHHVIVYIRRWAERRPNIMLSSDAYGNLKAELRIGRGRDSRPLVFSAHMDHPGFEAMKTSRGGRLQAAWRGWVLPEYFKGARVRFFSDDRWIRGTITSFTTHTDRGRRRVDRVKVDCNRHVAPGAIGMWNLPDPVIRGRRIYARACDDLAGVAALDELHRRNRPVHVLATFTRAEEVGFTGAIAGCKTGLYPKKARIVAVECSSVLPGVTLGGGPILRVGDASAIFSPGLTAWCGEVARDLTKSKSKFTFQRKLMDGGTCESAAFCELGFNATGLCVPLGNYHNMDRRRKRIAPEYIDLDDFARLTQWFIALATTDRRPETGNSEFASHLRKLHKQWAPRLRKTVHL